MQAMIGLGIAGVKGLPQAHPLKAIASPEIPIRVDETQTALFNRLRSNRHES